MQTIAICEDEKIWLDQLLQILQSIKTVGELQIHVFHSGEELLNDYSNGQFDLIFMDIYMSNMSGVDTVTKIREIDKSVPIAFTTTSLDHALEGYRLNVMKYLEKPVKEKDVLDCLKLAQMNKTNQKHITLLISGKEHSFTEEQILYIEQQNHSVHFHLADGKILSCFGKLNDLFGSLPMPPFYQCHKSFLVNLTNVIQLNHELKVFVMKDGSNAYINRNKIKEAGQQLDQFLFEQLRKDFN